MSNTRVMVVAVLGLLGVISACSGTETVIAGSDDTLTRNLSKMAMQADVLADEIVQMELDSMTVPSTAAPGGGPVVEQRSFSRSRPCPVGGEMSVAGNITRTYDPATRTLESEFTGERSRTDCAFAFPDAVLTINGSSVSEHFRRRVGGVPDGPQTSRYTGSWHALASTGEERSCSFDYTVVRDPSTMTRTIDGTACERVLTSTSVWHSN